MKFSEMSIFVFIASIIIGILISLNISFKGQNGSAEVLLSATQYQETYNTRNKLHTEISNLKEQYYSNLSKLDKYKYDNPDSAKVKQEISNELSKNSAILGSKEVSGKGLTLTLNDASLEFESSVNENLDLNSRLIHNFDIMMILNTLRNAGAQAISINDQRVLSVSEVYCYGPFMSVNGVKLPAPFYIKIIGNPDTVKNYILEQDSYLRMLKEFRKIKVQVDVSDNIKIPAYIGELKYKYMKEIN
jgi:uncharacterized protein YlxW (UPF0749 family)